jgi:polyketide biosynthesis acyl carrier protein
MMPALTTEVWTAVHDVLATILPTVRCAEVTGDKHLRDLGADSVDRVEIIVSLTERLGVDEPLSTFSSVRDLDELVALLADRRP